jgi:ATP-dependent DNA helicase
MPSLTLSPATVASSNEFSAHQACSQPSFSFKHMQDPEAMLNEADNDGKEDNVTRTNGDEEEDLEDVDGKAKALTNLLRTSSVSSPLLSSWPIRSSANFVTKVFVAIMADKMKEQQRQLREQALREAAKARSMEAKQLAPKPEPRRSTCAHEPEQGHDQDKSEQIGTLNPDSKPVPLRSRGRPPKNERSTAGIAQYFKKKDIAVADEAPTVQEALAQAADEYDAKPEGLGAQQLVATQQPALVTGGKMREYQLEGLEWLKSAASLRMRWDSARPFKQSR